MKKSIAIFLIVFLAKFSLAYGGVIQYIGTGKPNSPVKVSFSRNNGTSWEHKQVKPGQTFSVPKDATNLQINGVPRNPQKNYKVKDGNVF